MEPESERPAESSTIRPEVLLEEFRERSEALDARLDALQSMIEGIRGELRVESRESLSRLAQAAQDMANGIVYQQIDLQAKGELGALVNSLNTTLQNLQQLDASVKQQSTRVPELAAQLDAITADTEAATQSVMNRLDTLMAASDGATEAIQGALKALEQRQAGENAFQAEIDRFLDRAQEGGDPTTVAQDILDFLFTHRVTSRLAPVDLAPAAERIRSISDESFEILNELQFQDITRQKVEKVVLLLKQFQGGLGRLLEIFKLREDEASSEVFERRTVATQEHIFEASLEADHSKDSVDDIVARFKKEQG
ncbi:MAG: protein phosphatase CheZ [Acidobacteria bacterium]|nr:protein phosphatase CheZ [Acidobacteriota bacterium]